MKKTVSFGTAFKSLTYEEICEFWNSIQELNMEDFFFFNPEQ
jgi:hypothetical protein